MFDVRTQTVREVGDDTSQGLTSFGNIPMQWSQDCCIAPVMVFVDNNVQLRIIRYTKGDANFEVIN